MAVLYDYVQLSDVAVEGKTPWLKMKRDGRPMLIIKNVMASEKVVAVLDEATMDAVSQAEAADRGFIGFAMVTMKVANKPNSTSKVPIPLKEYSAAVGRNSGLVGDVIAGRTIVGTKPAGAPRLRR
jgi:hypothetical protein